MLHYDEEIEINKEIKCEDQKDQLKSYIMSKKLTKSQDFESDSTDESEISGGKMRSNQSIKFENMPVSKEIKDIFQNVVKYVSQIVDVDYRLYPFIPDFIPAVGDVDALLKVTCPDLLKDCKLNAFNEYCKTMSLSILDEPNGYQTEPSLLGLKFRSLFKNSSHIFVQTPVAKSVKDINSWIFEMNQIHISHSLISTSLYEDNYLFYVDNSMFEWSKLIENALKRFGYPLLPCIDISLKLYIHIICNLFDIVLYSHKEDIYLKNVQTIFNLFLAVGDFLE